MKFPILRALMIGNALECYDFLLYSLFVSILSPLFFPASDPLTALMMGFGIFAVGIAARPIGALIFGHWGDRYGRKNTLFVTLILMAVSTVGIGLLPTYEKIGLFAPFFLVSFRFLQGFASGGETSGAAIFGLEQTNDSKQGFVGALIRTSTSVGTISATLMGLLFTSDFMPEWGWRVPFCFGGLVAVVGLYLRRVLKETDRRKSLKIPLLQVIQTYPLSFLKTISIGGFLHVPFYAIAGYMNPTLHAKGLITSSGLMMMNMAATLSFLVFLPLMGYLSDKMGKKRMMTWGALGQIALTLPLFLIYTKGSLGGIVVAQMVFLMLSSAFLAPSSAYLNTLFPPECRYSGIALGTCLGTAFFGGTTPLLCSHLAETLGPLMGPSFYLIMMGLIGFTAVWRSRSSSILAQEC
jgi:MHS family proline/betaine transporter-like MFS transporter